MVKLGQHFTVTSLVASKLPQRTNERGSVWKIREGEVVLGNYLTHENLIFRESLHENFGEAWATAWKKERGPEFGGAAANDLILIDGCRSLQFARATEPPEEVDSSVYLFQYTYDHNFHHFIFGALPRLSQFLNHCDGESQILVRTSTPEYQREMIRALVSEDKWLLIDSKKHYRFSEVWITPFYESGHLGKIQDFYSQPALMPAPKGAETHHLVYLSRSDSAEKRPVKNLHAFEAKLASLGFEAITASSLGFADRVSIFGNAKIIIGTFSAGFANLVFARKCEVLIFIEHPKYAIPWHYAELCLIKEIPIVRVRRGLAARLLSKIGARMAPRAVRKITKSGNRPWTVNLRKVESAVKSQKLPQVRFK